MSKDELIDEVLSLENFKNDINVKFSELNDFFNNFEGKYVLDETLKLGYYIIRHLMNVI